MAGWLPPTLATLLLFPMGLLLTRVAAAEPAAAPGVVIVKLRAEGSGAVDACAEIAWRSGRPLAGATADRSDSLDRLQQRLGVRGVRALFRRPDGKPFAVQRQRLLARLHTQRTRAAAAPAHAEIPDPSHVYRVTLGPGVDPASAAASYSADPHVEWAQPDFLMQADFVPNDPFFHSSGSWGQPYADLWGLEKIRASGAWDYTQGEGSIVAVVDSGIDPQHPDIAANLWVNPGEDLDDNGRADPSDRNGIDDDDNGYIDDLIGFDFHNSVDADGDGDFGGPDDLNDADPTDDHGHGTHVAGIATAVGNNGIGITGVAPRARLMVLKGLGAEASGFSSRLALALVYAAQNGADVINTSWSCTSRCPVHPLVDEAVRLATALGSVVVDSAGNRADDIAFYSPENLRETIVVAATREDDSRSPSSSHGFLVDVAAPGAGTLRASDPVALRAILSLLAATAPPGWSFNGKVGDAYLRQSGTSMATPYVTGVVALVRSLHPDATPDEIRSLLRATARDVGAPGHDRFFGAGIVDALAAVTLREPRVRGVVAQPGPGAFIDARPGVIEVLGSADGDDFASFELAFGSGVDPSEWHEIPTATPGPLTDGLLASWDVDALSDGWYVLRLSVTSRSGEIVQEFQPFSLERNTPYAISSADVPAFAPDISDQLVVWEVTAEEVAAGRDVVARDLRSGPEIPVALEPGQQRSPRVSKRRIVYQDRGREPGGEIATCVVARESGVCEVEYVATGPAQRSAPVVSNDRILWVETDANGGSTRLCDLSHGVSSCSPTPIALRPARPFDLDVQGLRLVWREQQPVASVWTCLLNPLSLECLPRLVNDSLQTPFSPVVSGLFVAFDHLATIGSSHQLYVCKLDPRSGACPPQPIGAPSQGAPGLDISGDTIVWSHQTGEEGPSLAYCEYDAITRSCPMQQLTRNGASQSDPAIDGRRVVFADNRDGTSRIHGLDLPDLAVRGDRSLRELELLLIEISRSGPSREPLRIEAELLGGAPVESVGMRLWQLSDGSALLVWRPGPRAAGVYTVLLRGTTPGRLVTRETLQIVVRDRRPHRH